MKFSNQSSSCSICKVRHRIHNWQAFSSWNSIHPLGATALGDPWPPQQPVSVALCPSSPSTALYFVNNCFSSFRGWLSGFGTNYFYRVRSAPRPSPTWRTRVSLFVWVVALDLSGMGGPNSSISYRHYSTQFHVTTQAPPLHQSRDTFGEVSWN